MVLSSHEQTGASWGGGATRGEEEAGRKDERSEARIDEKERKLLIGRWYKQCWEVVGGGEEKGAARHGEAAK